VEVVRVLGELLPQLVILLLPLHLALQVVFARLRHVLHRIPGFLEGLLPKPGVGVAGRSVVGGRPQLVYLLVDVEQVVKFFFCVDQCFPELFVLFQQRLKFETLRFDTGSDFLYKLKCWNCREPGESDLVSLPPLHL